MEPTTVIGCISALADAFDEGSDHYALWKRKRSRQNHYQRSGPDGQREIITCALSTSLAAAGTQLKETYGAAFTILGSDFSAGDAACRALLCNQLFTLRSRVAHLHRAADSSARILNIPDVLQTSETARISSLKALADLYRRIAAGRPVPTDLPVPKPRSRRRHRSGSLSDDRSVDHESSHQDDRDDDEMTTVMTVSTEHLRFQSEPPSPPPTPPTPKPPASDAASTIAPSEAGGTRILRPKVSVFSMFCPEAMVLQVDLSKPVPEKKRCKCGYRWKVQLADKKDFIVLKEGFRMSSRFLAKSHSDKDVFGCILCVSSGKTETYESPELLGVHINSSHTKWQILHERDIA
ncbi:hypothetical protein CPLU01_11291 [Colletotrichum plurivorum]|uniref:Uncharacterized protein n=1 Tax=Colletotrichum plurivorum TaxID=2175906 RepID=A0A8H6K2Q2_9PEZI|nr:hypothetical protein CPLU01_11291 [Colletotrichum plurivorum]